ncbi:DUF4276 family protein [Dethiosulfovibrio salsuginis]|uniref:DUF4276 family protein n=1 Tax=Dethiosulfovibrio salsuginis TaxID=561720 RepID=A0A1X7K5H4_9BACT|nr:DUF4276 family protein [Dethiosulfovibrio salsuginis]SMG36013.1 protein of unknown function [Dethiosulfovibrio salsuginis]
MKIVIIVEGKTEKVFLPHLREFLKDKIPNRMPKIEPLSYDGRIPKGDKLKNLVDKLLRDRRPADYVIALTDVYTGSNPPDFKDAEDAKEKMRIWVGKEPRFFPHAAQHDFEAWLLPYWKTIQSLAKHDRGAPSATPELVNHGKPPAECIKEIFEAGKSRSYSKTRDAARILKDNDLSVSIERCPELKKLVNRIIELCGGQAL